jgi:DNA-binding Lrp family transcriptional regulator
MKAAILVFTEAGKFDEVVDELKKITGVKHAFAVAGRADVAALVEVPDLKGLSNLALKVFKTPGVTASETLVEVQTG